MQSIRQLGVLIELSARSINQRAGASFVICAGVAGVVSVLLSVLAISGTLIKSIQGNGDPLGALVMSQGATSEGSSALPRDALRLIRAVRGLQTIDGDPAASGEALFIAPVREIETNKRAQIIIRGATLQATSFRPEIRIVEGHEPRPGLQELIVGSSASARYRSLQIGDSVTIRGSQWPIVGRFEANGSARATELLGDADTLMSAYQINTYNAVYVKLTSASAFSDFRDVLTLDPALSVTVMREREYYRLQSEPIARAWRFVAYIASGIMALGAMFGAANTTYSAISARSKEIATLRAIGFGGFEVVGSVLLEVTGLAIIGALVGSALVWLVFDGVAFSTSLGAGRVVAELHLDPILVLFGIAWACVVGLASGLAPAVHAARLPVASALRDT